MSFDRPARLPRAVRLALACFVSVGLVGLAATGAVLLGAPDRRLPSALTLAAGTIVAATTVVNLALRFVRWHYLLRRCDVRLPMRASLGVFGGSFALLPVPLFLGQLVARVRGVTAVLPDRERSVLFVSTWERVLDLGALVLVAGLATLQGPGAAGVAVITALVLVPGARHRLVAAAERVAQVAANVLGLEPARAGTGAAAVARPAAMGVAVGLSVLAWGVTVLSIVPLARAAGSSAASEALVAAAAFSVLAGGVSLAPVGVGVAGFVLVGRLHTLGVEAASAAEITFVFRMATAWLTVALGVVAFVAFRRRRAAPAGHQHFDSIDAYYDSWLPPHYRMHLVARKTAPMRARVRGRAGAPLGLDVGCGRGWYAHAMMAAGARIAGVDASTRQLLAARRYLGGQPLLSRGSVEALPFHPGTFDFAYIVNVLHHVGPRGAQERALGEIAQVLRPGGLLFVHEMNVVNPLFRFYLGYVFPILKGIEEGTEYYLDTRTLPVPTGLRVLATEYFTFVPDFVPAAVLPWAARVEQRLERSRLGRYAAHFVAIYERMP